MVTRLEGTGFMTGPDTRHAARTIMLVERLHRHWFHERLQPPEVNLARGPNHRFSATLIFQPAV